MARQGLFITFEGGEGAGKSTQIRSLEQHLVKLGRQVVMTREPGGTPGAEDIRELLVTGDTHRWSVEAETLLNFAARDDHLQKVIRPALAAGKTVLCDRFIDSTRAYQGHAGGCSLELIDALEAAIVGETRPDVTFILDLEPALGLARAKQRATGEEDRFERKGMAFHKSLRAAFRSIAEQEPERCILVDASQPIDKTAETIQQAVAERLTD
ncbi:MAG: dTMP kinase [Aestuariivirgaceae bacterium]